MPVIMGYKQIMEDVADASYSAMKYRYKAENQHPILSFKSIKMEQTKGHRWIQATCRNTSFSITQNTGDMAIVMMFIRLCSVRLCRASWQ